MTRAIVQVRVTALEIACITLHWAARDWQAGLAAELRKLADEMAERAKRLRGSR